MTAIPLFARHGGRHRAQPSRPRPLRRLRALIARLELRLAWWEWAPVQAWHTRQYKRADRKALAAEMAARHIPAHASTERIYAGGRNLGTLPRTPYPSAADPVMPVATDDQPPWAIETAQQPVLDERDAPDEDGLRRYLEREADVRAQWDEARERHPEVPLPPLRACCPTADGEEHTRRCKAGVDEAQRLAEVMIP